MKLICTASKVSWFTVGREYDATWITLKFQWLLRDDAGDSWELEDYANGYRTERLEDAEFSIAQVYEPVTAADDPFDDYLAKEMQEAHEDILAAVMQMANEEGIGTEFNAQVVKLRKVFDKLAKKPETQRAFLLALAYIGEEKSQ